MSHNIITAAAAALLAEGPAQWQAAPGGGVYSAGQ